ncbi:hypothetical protein FIBSPDRAFT_261730 [Athelia psychrophila]|uniref:Uncharacterized protein n=1 Tax=Athelia psychrophila TaxID=1759441 RepID=A0A165XH93_9AGAM|nr:hypothetical protein FIBSPDRAFT_261730 [Fibularhizoctonia sp. CBS 109695]
MHFANMPTVSRLYSRRRGWKVWEKHAGNEDCGCNCDGVRCEKASLPPKTKKCDSALIERGTIGRHKLGHSAIRHQADDRSSTSISSPFPKPDPALLGDFDGECGGLRYIAAVGPVVTKRQNGIVLVPMLMVQEHDRQWVA